MSVPMAVHMHSAQPSAWNTHGKAIQFASLSCHLKRTASPSRIRAEHHKTEDQLQGAPATASRAPSTPEQEEHELENEHAASGIADGAYLAKRPPRPHNILGLVRHWSQEAAEPQLQATLSQNGWKDSYLSCPISPSRGGRNV